MLFRSFKTFSQFSDFKKLLNMTEGVFEKTDAGPNAVDITPNKDGGIMKEVKVSIE